MRWSPRGAHLMLQVRTAIVNETLEADHRSMSQRRRSFRMPASSPPCLGRFPLPPGNAIGNYVKMVQSIPMDHASEEPHLIASGQVRGGHCEAAHASEVALTEGEDK